MKRTIALLVLGSLAVAIMGCHASGHADSGGVGAAVKVDK